MKTLDIKMVKKDMKDVLFLRKIKGSVITALFTALVCTSCNPLGLEPVDKVGEDQFWENTQLAQSYIDRFYLWNPVSATHFFTTEQWSDNAIGNDSPDNTNFRQTKIFQRNYDAITTPGTAPWANQYKNIRAVNVGIERVPTVSGLDESTKNQLLAECYFFRAWLYFELEQYWGAVPIVDRVLTVMDDTMIPRSSREDLFRFILSDLDKSIELFKLSDVALKTGKVNIHAAELVKSRVALYAACAADASAKGLYNKLPASQESKDLFHFNTSPAEYYTLAFNAANNVIGKYSLDPDYANLFNSANGNVSKESIWPVMFNDQKRSGFNPASVNAPGGNYYAGNGDKAWGVQGSAFPTQDLVDCYYQKDEIDGKWKQWWKTNQVKTKMNASFDDVSGDFKGVGENYHVMYENRDKRFYATIIYDSCYYAKNLVRTWVDNTPGSEKFSALNTGFLTTINLDAPTGRGNSSMTITSYYPKKYMQEIALENGELDKKQPKTCYFMLRYAEVLLNYAEAAIKLNKTSEATDAINQIRLRAGLDNFDASVVGHDLWEEYKIQRRTEFAFEVPCQRYFDLLRWNESEGNEVIDEINRGPKAMLIFRKGVEIDQSGKKGYPLSPEDEGYFVPQIETRRFDYEIHQKKFDNAKYYFFPFAESLLESYNGFIQNPGW